MNAKRSPKRASPPARRAARERRDLLMVLPDQALLARARRCDYESFQELVSRHRVRVYSLALHALQDAEQAERVFHETFLGAWRELPELPDGGEFGSWLAGLAGRRILERVRFQIAQPMARPILLRPKPSRTWPGREAAQTARGAVVAAVAGLPALQRVAFMLCEVGECSPAEIAAALETRPEVVRGYVHDATLRVISAIDACLRPPAGRVPVGS
jgi:RNA polymerase sigma-70 factor, ECF subfamily